MDRRAKFASVDQILDANSVPEPPNRLILPVQADAWIAVYDPDSGELLYRAPGSVCQSCRDIVLGTELDDDGRCRTCGPLEITCEDCDCDWPAEDLCVREMRLLCPGCAEDRELELSGSGVWTLADEARSGGV